MRALFKRKHDELFYSTIDHYENDAPIQAEDRYVNPALSPECLAQDFTGRNPNEYLTQVAPIERVNSASKR